MKSIEGENDGLLTPRAVMWGDFRGHIRSATNRGISHCDEVDLRRRSFSKRVSVDNGITDIVDFYRDVAIELRDRGY